MAKQSCDAGIAGPLIRRHCDGADLEVPRPECDRQRRRVGAIPRVALHKRDALLSRRELLAATRLLANSGWDLHGRKAAMQLRAADESVNTGWLLRAESGSPEACLRLSSSFCCCVIGEVCSGGITADLRSCLPFSVRPRAGDQRAVSSPLTVRAGCVAHAASARFARARTLLTRSDGGPRRRDSAGVGGRSSLCA